MYKIVGLGSLRGLAIILVIVYHLFRNFLPGGFVAVEIFFAISGFLIARKLLREYEEDRTVHFLKFITTRFKRIFPMLLICVLLTLGLGNFVDSDMMTGVRQHAFEALTFSTNIANVVTESTYESNLIPNVFGHTWFVALEMQFYLTFPLVLLLILSLFRRVKDGFRVATMVFGTLAALSAVLMCLYGVVYGSPDRAYFGLDSNATALMLGAALAAFCAVRGERSILRFRRQTAKRLVAAALAIIILMSFLLSFNSPLTFAVGLPLTGLLSALLIACVIDLQPRELQPRRHRVPSLLRPFEYIGSISFGLYLFHWPLYLLMPFLLPSAPAWLPPIITIIVSFILAALAGKYIESGRIFHVLRIPEHPKKRAIAGVILLVILAIPVVALLRAPERSSIEEQLESQAAIKNDAPEKTAAHVDYTGVELWLDDTKGLIMPHFNTVANVQSKPEAVPPVSSVSSADVLVIGDSVTLGAKTNLQSTVRGSFVDAAESRGIEAANGILANYKVQGKLPKIIVISLVTNQRNITESRLQSIIDVAGQDRNFIFVTAYAGLSQPREVQNSVLKGFAKERTNVYIADWWAIATSDSSLLYADRIHLNPAGRQAYANLILDTIIKIGS